MVMKKDTASGFTSLFYTLSLFRVSSLSFVFVACICLDHHRAFVEFRSVHHQRENSVCRYMRLQVRKRAKERERRRNRSLQLVSLSVDRYTARPRSRTPSQNPPRAGPQANHGDEGEVRMSRDKHKQVMRRGNDPCRD